MTAIWKIWLELPRYLHWLNVPQRVSFKVYMTVYKCLHGLARPYLTELRVPVADVGARRRLRSASRGLLDSPSQFIIVLWPI